MVVVRQLSCVMWSCRGLRHRLLDVVRELVATPRSLVVLLLAELVATISSPGVVAFVLDGLKVKAAVVNPIP